MNTEYKETNKKDWIFPFIVLLMSLVNIGLHYNNLFTLSVLNSLLGITGIILFFRKISFFRVLIYLWIFVQFFVIQRVTVETYGGPFRYVTIWDCTQAFIFWTGIHTGTYLFKLNFVPIFLFAILRFLEIISLIGKTLTFTKFREDNGLGDIFPFSGKVLKRVRLDNERDWLLVELNTEIEYEGNPINYILVKNKAATPIRSGASGQIVFVRLVYDVHHLWKGKNNKERFPFVDWTLCK